MFSVAQGAKPLKAKKWVVIGAGYGGLAFAARWSFHYKSLSQSLRSVPSLYLINPSLQSDCTCELYKTLRTGRPQYFSLKEIFKNRQVQLKESRVIKIHPSEKILSLRGEQREEFKYDRLIVSTGVSKLPGVIEGIDEVMSLANPLEPRIFGTATNQQLLELRMALSRLKWMQSGPAKPSSETFVVVVGGGATGVEIAGELANLRSRDRSKRVIVVEKSYDPLQKSLGFGAYKMLRNQMKSLNIEYFEGSGVTRADSKHLYLDNGQVIPWDLLVVTHRRSKVDSGQGLFEEFGSSQKDDSVLRVNRDFQIADWPDHYAIGDLAAFENLKGSLPKTAQVASQQGFYLADRMAAELRGEPVPEFKWQDWGYLVSLGPGKGAGRLGPTTIPFLWGPTLDLAKQAAQKRFEWMVTKRFWPFA